jgi:hypothetical protein
MVTYLALAVKDLLEDFKVVVVDRVIKGEHKHLQKNYNPQ